MDEQRLRRRDFLMLGAAAAAGFALFGAGCGGEAEAPAPAASAATGAATTPPSSPEAPAAPKETAASAYLSIATGKDPAAVTRAAVAALGGMERFVRGGDDVVVKPNICTASRGPEYAATTDPVVVATLVRLCLEAGAKQVRVMDSPFSGTPEAAYADSGIAAAVEKAGGDMEIMSPMKYAVTAIPKGLDVKEWPVYRDILDADVVVNVPVAKQHGSTGLTLGCKNLMGVILDRGDFHSNLSQRIADLTSLVQPALTVIDATRILTANGPTGGDLGDVKHTDTVIASADVVAADAEAATLFGMKGTDLGYLVAAERMGIGRMSVPKRQVARVSAG